MNPNQALTKLPPQVPVDLNEKVPTDSEAVAALRRMGCVDIGQGDIQDLRTVGIHIHGAGTIRHLRGSVTVTQQRLEGAMRMVYDEMVKAKDWKGGTARATAMVKLAQGLGYLAARKVDAQKFMLELEGGRVTPDNLGDFGPTVRAFAPGSEVKPNQTLITARDVHIHSSEPPATAK